MLQACLNGARTLLEHPRVPVTSDVLAEEAARVVAAGAAELHVHPRDRRGGETLAPDAVGAAVEALRRAVPGAPVGVTTALWAAGDPARRLRQVAAWSVLPDYVSLNWHEDGADELAALLLRRGIGIEAGLWHAEGVAAWNRSPHRDRCLRLLIELPDGMEDVVAGLERLAGSLLDRPGTPILLHGEGSSAWPALQLAVERGLDTRIGLEDTLALPDGRTAPDNEALVRAAGAVGRA